jgi:hypothetical protein
MEKGRREWEVIITSFGVKILNKTNSYKPSFTTSFFQHPTSY